MTDFRVGDEVVCLRGVVKDTFGRSFDLLEVGGVYTIAEVGLYRGFATDLLGSPGVHLCEAENQCETAGCDVGFCPSRFRKVQKPNSYLSIESFLTIKPGQHEEPKRIAAPKPVKERV